MTKISTYVVTLGHHSLARAAQITINGTLTQAKRAATKRFGDGYQDHVIEIYEHRAGFALAQMVAFRTIRNKAWTRL